MKFVRLFFLTFLFVPAFASAQVAITEIMYDLSGSDTGREWVEIRNSGSEPIDFSKLKFFEANTNHALTLSRGEATTSVGGYAVIADDPTKFMLDWPNFSGTLFGSSFSLSNTGEMIAIKNAALATLDSVTYTSSQGAGGDGNSLQLLNGVWSAGAPSLGQANTVAAGSTPPVATSTSQTSGGGSFSNPASAPLSSDGVLVGTTGGTSGYAAEPQIVAKAHGPSAVISGAPASFTGEVFGLKGEPIQNARYLWSFGDGGSAVGVHVLHEFMRPGKYLVVLEASSEIWNTSARLAVEAIPTPISISSVEPSQDGGITLRNGANAEVELSSWQIESAGRVYILPKNTVALPNAELFFPAGVIGFVPVKDDARLLYPNGEVAVVFIPTVKSIPVAVSVTPAVSKSVQTKKPVVLAPTLLPNKSDSLAAVAPADDSGAGATNTPISHSSTSRYLYLLGGVVLVGLGGSFFLSSSEKSASAIPNYATLADEITILEDEEK